MNGPALDTFSSVRLYSPAILTICMELPAWQCSVHQVSCRRRSKGNLCIRRSAAKACVGLTISHLGIFLRPLTIGERSMKRNSGIRVDSNATRLFGMLCLNRNAGDVPIYTVRKESARRCAIGRVVINDCQHLAGRPHDRQPLPINDEVLLTRRRR